MNIADTQHAPESSVVTFELTNVAGSWYLHGIPDDHVVPDCGATNS